MRLRLLLVTAALWLSCTPGPAPKKEPLPHPRFPIVDGATHALGKTTPRDGEVKCASCHLPTQTNYAQFSCTGCHEHAEDAMLARHSGVEGYAWESTACYGCHGNGIATRIRHDPAHDLLVTSYLPVFSDPSTIASFTVVDAGVPMEMNHAQTTLPCASCHANAELGDFFPGIFHGSLVVLDAGQPTRGCGACHTASAPVGLVGPVVPRDPPSPEMRHDVAPAMAVDCWHCHDVPALDAGWQTTKSFHANATPATCIECHANSRPPRDAGVLDSTNATLLPGVKIDHNAPVWLTDCAPCHRSTTAWDGGTFHPQGPTAACLPCHAGERPVQQVNVVPPFDFGTNARGNTHGAAQDCVLCHRSTTSRWDAGFFGHDAGTVVNGSCVPCHTTQRPSTLVAGFDHASSGTGDCFGCHQVSTMTPRASLGDWAGGNAYPGPFLISSSDRFIVVSSSTLRRNDAGFVSAQSPPVNVTLYNAMLHTSRWALDAGESTPGSCLPCHAGAPASYADAGFHAARGASQPTDCTDCHALMRPPGVVQRTNLRPMDHSRTGDCAACHPSPGGAWSTGTLHAQADGGPLDCVSCHFPLMADAAKVDVMSAASQAVKHQMRHRSGQVTDQRCDTCHKSALGRAPGGAVVADWQPGELHRNVATQPTACKDCHAITVPPGQTTSAAGEVMIHSLPLVTAKDCAFCHAADAVGGTWSRSTRFHIAGIATAECTVCHADDKPMSIFETDAGTSASPATGVSGQHDRIDHGDSNVSTRDCGFCHSPGTQWNGAKFHAHFTGSATLNGGCRGCHENLIPLAQFTAFDHGSIRANGTDCNGCHQWPGPSGPANPTWRRQSTASAPQFLSVGGFSIPSSLAAGATQSGVNGLAHPAVPAGGSCTTCHMQAGGGRRAFGYDHALAPATGCSSCHEAGSDLVGTSWTQGSAMVAASCARGSGSIAASGGDTRPIDFTGSLPCRSGATTQTVAKHFYPVDCGECHQKPAAVPAVTQTGAPYATAWRFVHNFGAPAQQSTCGKCH